MQLGSKIQEQRKKRNLTQEKGVNALQKQKTGKCFFGRCRNTVLTGYF